MIVQQDSATSSEYSVPFKEMNTSSQWLSEGLREVEEGGRTPLHIACDRDDDYKVPLIFAKYYLYMKVY